MTQYHNNHCHKCLSVQRGFSCMYRGRVLGMQLSGYLVLLSTDSEAGWRDRRASMTWPIPIVSVLCFNCWFHCYGYVLCVLCICAMIMFGDNKHNLSWVEFTHWGRVTHICVSKLTIIGSDNGLSPDRRQAIIWTNPGLLLIGPFETNSSEILIGIHAFSFKKIYLKLRLRNGVHFVSASMC